ncbi:MAG: hypothetical protein R2827_03630 [Bdellovibrionales bacterium]
MVATALSHQNSHSPEDLPHYELIESIPSLSSNCIYTTLISQRLTVRDAYINVGSYCFRVADMIDEKASELKRVKKGALEFFIPMKDYITTELPHKKPVSKKAVIRAYRHLGPKRERSCEHEIVMKGTLISLVKALDEMLIGSSEEDVQSPFEKSELRYSTIAEWINWVFMVCYGITSSYNGEQVRQMLEKPSKYSGRFVTIPIGI